MYYVATAAHVQRVRTVGGDATRLMVIGYEIQVAELQQNVSQL